MKRLLLIALLFCPALLLAQSQTPSHSQAFHMNSLILDTIDEYVRTASLADKNDIPTFVRLFADRDNPCVFNDLVGTNGYKSQMTPSEYAASIDSDNGSLLIFDVRNVLKASGFFLSEGKWHRRIRFEKYVMFIDASVYSGKDGGVFFDTDYLFGTDNGGFQLEMDMVYEPEVDRCLISSIKPLTGVPSSALDEDMFYVVVRPDDTKSDNILYKGKPLRFNEYGQSFVDDISQLDYASDDYAVKTTDYAVKTTGKADSSSPKYKVVDLQFRKLHHLRFKPRYSMVLGNAFSMSSSPEGVNFANKSKASEFGLDFGFLFIKGKNARFGFYTGLAYSMSQISMNAENFTYSYFPTREYSVTSAHEALAFKDLMIPLYFEYEQRLGKYVNLSVDLGAKFYLTQKNEIMEPYVISGTVNGGNPFSINSNDAGFLDPGVYAKQPYDLSFIGNIELDVRILNPLWIFVSVGYEYGIPSVLPAYKPDEIRAYYSPQSATPVFPVVFGGGDNLLFRSFVQSVSFHRQSLWLSFGLKIKLNI